MITCLNLGKYGRFGNQLFQIAGTIGYATRYGYQFGFPEWEPGSFFANRLPEINGAGFDLVSVPWGVVDITIHDNSSLSGYMQSEQYFCHCADLVRYYFTLSRLTDFTIEPDSVAVHIRLGDYKESRHHIAQNASYYLCALSHLKFTGKIYVFSDEPKIARLMLGDGPVYFTGNHYMVDFYLMTRCTNFVISASSYSWWAAWLGSHPGKKVIAPKNWFGPAKKISARDIYCNNWIVL